MRKLIVAEHISLDGVVQGPGGPQEDTSDGFALGGWTVPFASDSADAAVMQLHEQPFELLLGRRTYDIWADYWPNVPAGNAIADAFNGTTKHVATHRPDSLEWGGSKALEGPLEGGVERLKATEGADLLTWGSSDLVRQLLKFGLVDTLALFVYPVILGGGKRLFGEQSIPSTFEVAQSETSKTGVQVLRLIRSGEVRTGSFT